MQCTYSCNIKGVSHYVPQIVFNLLPWRIGTAAIATVTARNVSLLIIRFVTFFLPSKVYIPPLAKIATP